MEEGGTSPTTPNNNNLIKTLTSITQTEISNLKLWIGQLSSRLDEEVRARKALEEKVKVLQAQLDAKQTAQPPPTVAQLATSSTTRPRSPNIPPPPSSATSSSPPFVPAHIPQASSTSSTNSGNDDSSVPTPPTNRLFLIEPSSPPQGSDNTQPPDNEKKPTSVWQPHKTKVAGLSRGVINDEVLFDSTDMRITKEGALDKMGVTNPSWKARYFRLQNGVLFYYKTQKDKKPIGEIVLHNCSVYPSPSKRSLAFTVNVPFREFLLCAHTEEDRNQWIAEIKNCITNEIVVTH